MRIMNTQSIGNYTLLDDITNLDYNVSETNSSGQGSLQDSHNVTQPDGGGSLLSNPTYKLALGLLMWLLPIIITVGTIGNIFSFIVMLQREMRQTSTFFYLAVLAIADTIVLFMSAFKTWFRLCSGFEMLHISDASCKLFTFLTYFSLHMSAWLIVAVTVERFIVVWFPLKATSICSAKRAKLTTLGIGLGFFLLNAHLFWTADLITDPKSGRKTCAMLQNNRFLYEEVLPWVHLTLYSFVPFVSLLVFNVLIIISLIKHRQIISSQMTRADKRTRYNHRRLAITLLCISFVWIITTTPSALYTVLPLKGDTVTKAANFFLIKVICYIFMYINHSINFFLYCITGQAFRREFMKIVCRTCRKRRKPKPRLTFRASRSGSGQETVFPLMENMYGNRGRFLCCTRTEEPSTRQSPLTPVST
ncbi:probable G-protein coupled receptor 139 [Mercenaria mercenaria]|uniref:probable G-protein coupled receptor 139 n=1 Tax=Mercenaria mercenaria TaxID=6596 RepID=UPI001E1D78B1|nr:probable G-protein coupled receptor 139 [Mercenaria mercenaria]